MKNQQKVKTEYSIKIADLSCDSKLILSKSDEKKFNKYFDIKIPEYQITNAKSKCNYVRCMYKYQLGNTLLIGLSCYLQNSYESKEYLAELHKILSENMP